LAPLVGLMNKNSFVYVETYSNGGNVSRMALRTDSILYAEEPEPLKDSLFYMLRHKKGSVRLSKNGVLLLKTLPGFHSVYLHESGKRVCINLSAVDTIVENNRNISICFCDGSILKISYGAHYTGVVEKMTGFPRGRLRNE